MDGRDEVVANARERRALRINERLFVNTRCSTGCSRACILRTHFPRFVSDSNRMHYVRDIKLSSLSAAAAAAATVEKLSRVCNRAERVFLCLTSGARMISEGSR